MSKAATPATGELSSLTPRERDVLLMVGKGFTTAEVARLLEMTVPTVGWYIKTIFRKLQVSSRVEAAVLACKAGWL
jgi:DNA-binding CsgD family transcriptional regulator